MPSFSQRIGKTPTDVHLQVEGMDEALRVGVWNALWRTLIDDPWAKPKPTLRVDILDDIWEHFFRQPSDETPGESQAILARLKDWLVETEWYRIYDLLEFLHTVLPPTEIASYEHTVNRALDGERSAYRMMKGGIVPLTDAAEVDELMRANEKINDIGIIPAQDHLAAAVHELGKRREQDYEKSVREATAAVQSVARWVAGKEIASILDAFNQVDPGELIPTTFKQGLASIFDTEESQGSGHPFQQSRGTVGLPEARFTLVAASAVINYLIALLGPDRIEEEKQAREQITGTTDDSRALPPGE